MNDSERVKVADVIETELDSYCPSPFNGAFAVSLMQIIDRLLTDRAVPEPDADMVHALHEALVNSAPDWIIDREDGELLDMARAALQAAGTDADWLDAVEWEEIHVSKGDDGTGVVIEVEGVPDSRGRRVVIATGATLGEAIAAAVRQATGTEGSE